MYTKATKTDIKFAILKLKYSVYVLACSAVAYRLNYPN